MMKMTVIDVTREVRIGGEADIYVEVEGNEVKRAFFICRAPVRGFEKLLVGKNIHFAVEASMRICGICHAAHGIACCEAIEHALGICPPRDGILLREACGIANRIQSHLLQQILVMNDFFPNDEKRKVEKLLFESLEISNRILFLIGGSSIHPSNIVIGGMMKGLSEHHLNTLQREINKLTEFLENYSEIFSVAKL